ncbi:MAG: hypothetical protein GAK44_00304 [Pseudomonas delhiensis]|nr:MAG: hypothetical protein GAK44_00304 [Pseudomonas delhiensis]
MGDRHDYVALEWVKGEIAETLKQARQALEVYVENPQDPTRMGFCLAYIHQVRGTLQMVEFYGAALLAEEMEHLAQALIDDSVTSQREALEVLMQAILQLPVYLDRIQTARRDLPMVVLPLLNDLRAARGEKLLSETSLFAPDLSQRQVALPVDALARLRTAELPVLLRKLRQMLQVAIVGVLRNHDLPTNLGYMARVFARLESLCKDAPLEQLWSIASGIVEGLANGSIQNGTSMRTLLRQIDHELKRLIEEGADGMNQPAPDELVKNLLFYVAKASDQSPRVRALKDAYRLDDALPGEAVVDEERARLAGPDRDAMRSVVGALCEELVRVKDSLDLFVRSDRSAVAELRPLLVPLKQIADTLAVLGFGQPRKVILDQIDVVGDLVNSQREPSDGALMDVAGALLYVEATLAGMAGPGEERGDEENRLPTTDVGQIHQVVIKEARNGLELAKDSIIEFIASQWNHEHLAKVPELLTQVRGGLSMIEQARAATLLEACNRYIQEQLLARKAVPDWNSLDTLADAITGVEYYLERLSDDQGTQSDLILDVAEESLESLGYALRSSNVEPEPEPEPEPELEPIAPAAAAVVAGAAALAAESQAVGDERDADAGDAPQGLANELSEAAEAYADVPAWDLTLQDDDQAASLALEEAGSPRLEDEPGTLSLEQSEVAPELAWDLAPSADALITESAEPAPAVADDWLLSAEQPAESQATELAWELPSAPAEPSAPALGEVTPAPVQPEPLAQEVTWDLSADLDASAALADAGSAGIERPSLAVDESLPELAWELSPEPTEEPALLALDDNWSLGELPATEPLDEGVDLSLDAPLEISSGELAGASPVADEWSLDSLDLEPAPVAPLVLEDPLALGDDLPLLEPLSLDAAAADRTDDAPAVEDGWLLSETLPSAVPVAEPSGTDLSDDLQWEFDTPAPAAAEPLTLADSEWLLDTPLSPASEPLDLSGLSLESLEVEPAPELAGDQPVELSWELEVLPSAETADGAPVAADELPMLDGLEDWPETPLPTLDEAGAGASSWNGLDIDSLDLPEVALPQAAVQPEAPAVEPTSSALTLADVLATPTQAINPPARDIPPSLLPPPADEEPVDEELREVFIEEAAEVLETIGEHLPRWQAATDNREALSEIRRAFHTLKGSGRMVRALVIGELAWSIENLLNRVLDRSIPADAAVLDVVAQVTALMPELVEEYAASAQRQRDDVDYLAATAHALAKGLPVPPPNGGERAPSEPVPTAAADEPEAAAAAQAPEVDEGLDPQLLDIFRNEAEAHLETLVGFLADCSRELPQPVTDDLQRALHTLKGSAHMAGILPIAEIATPLERLVKEFKTNQLQVDLREAELLHEAEQLFRIGLDQLVAGRPLAPIAGSDALLARIAQVHQERLDAAEAQRRGETGEAGSDPQMIGVFLSEGMDILLDAEELLKRWREHPEQRQELGALRAELETLGRGAHLADLPQMGELCDALLTVYDAVQQGELAVNEAFFVAAEQAHECLIGMMDQVAAALEVSPCPEQVAALQRLLLATTTPTEPLLDLDTLSAEDFPLEDDQPLSARMTAPADLPEGLAVSAEASLAPEAEVEAEVQPEPLPTVAPAPVRVLDDEMVEIFLEEAVDILESAGQALDQWRATPDVLSPLSTLQRDLHTLKGGARMADIREIGDLSHELESLYEGLLDRRFQGSPALLDLLQTCHDCLAGHLDQLQAHQTLTDPQALIRAIRDFRQSLYGPET